MKKLIVFCLAACLALPLFSQARGKVNIPDLKGYVTLKCDFHMHTIFSDGSVWPVNRVEEAYRDGLDAISITDHLEYLPKKDDIKASHNRSYEIAEPTAKARGIMLIRGTEITRDMPPGHANAIFITNADAIATPDYMDAYRAAKAQNAFIFWNHPGWLSQQPDTTLWWPEHTTLYNQGMMHGIEVVNGEYYPEAHRWCLEKNLTMICNTDSHGPISAYAPGKHRSMTLVFARAATPEAIREALNERRTAVYHEEFVIGKEIYLKELFENALEWSVVKNDNGIDFRVTVRNKSDLTFRLKKANSDRRVIYFRNTSIFPYIIAPNATQTFTVRLLDGINSGDLNFIVDNFLVQPNEGMRYTYTVRR